MRNSTETEPEPAALNSNRVGIAMVAGVALVVRTVGGWLLLREGDPERSAPVTVRQFLQAQRSGDCGAVFGLLTEESRTNRGRLTQAEFLDLCATATKDITAKLDSVELLSQEGDQATVGVSISISGSRYGHVAYLVVENGEWRVDATRGDIRVGPTYPEVLQAFFAAYEDRDCSAMANHQADTAPGLPGRKAYMRWCASKVAGKSGELELDFYPRDLEQKSPDRIDFIEATTVEYNGLDGGAFRESAALIYRGLQWRIDASGSFGGFAVVDAVTLAEDMLDESVVSGLVEEPASFRSVLNLGAASGRYAAEATYYGGVDEDVASVERRALRQAGFEYGGRAVLGEIDGAGLVSVDVLVFENEAGASGYAEDLARRFREIEPRSGGGVDDARVAEPSGTHGVVLRDYDGDPTDAYLVQAKGNKVVRVVARNMPTGADPLSYAVQALKLQLERL